MSFVVNKLLILVGNIKYNNFQLELNKIFYFYPAIKYCGLSLAHLIHPPVQFKAYIIPSIQGECESLNEQSNNPHMYIHIQITTRIRNKKLLRVCGIKKSGNS